MATCQRKNLGQTTASLAASVIRNAAVVALISLFYCTGRENAQLQPFRKRPKAAETGKDNTPVSGHAVWPSSAMKTVTAETDSASLVMLVYDVIIVKPRKQRQAICKGPPISAKETPSACLPPSQNRPVESTSSPCCGLKIFLSSY